jgi:mRNA-degrading endonuclease toxin of MazEF toxin-antitoxin module
MPSPQRGEIWLLVSKERLCNKWGRIGSATLNQVEDRVRILLGL